MRGAGVGFGVLLPTFGAGSMPGSPRVVEAARLAEELGFDSLWADDQLAHPAPALDAPTCMAASAAVTERIALGFGVLLLGLRNPAWTANQLIAIDLLAGGGRLRLGVGADGELPTGPDGTRADPSASGARSADERFARLDDTLAVIGDLLTGRPVDYAGGALSVRAPALAPALASPPPLYVGGRGEPALRRAARFGDAWMAMWLAPAEIAERSQLLGEMALEEGRPAPAVAALIGVRIDDDRNRAHAHARAHAAERYAMPAEAVESRALLDSIDGAVERLYQFVDVGVSELVLVTLGSDTLEQYERLAEVRGRLASAAETSGTAP
jgi:alkanesulfonate monooxygenase SsuD/methylene tetrahydromethanopterin reductase-like flavin-dependent oxidoreductase (luciferase family)